MDKGYLIDFKAEFECIQQKNIYLYFKSQIYQF